MSPQDKNPADADPPTQLVKPGARSEPVTEPAEADPGKSVAKGAASPAAEAPADADPPTRQVVESPAESVAEVPADADPAESVADSPEVGPPADADPPTESADEPVAEGGEPAADSSVDVHDVPADADPPTEPVNEPPVPAAAELSATSSEVAEVPADADPPTEPVAEEPGSPAELAVADSPAPADADPPTEPVVADSPAPADADPPAEPAAESEAADELPELTDDELESTLEALLLVVDSPVEVEALADATGTSVARVNETLLRMAADYTARERGLDLRHAGGGWRYYTRDRYAPYVEKLLLGGQRAKLTRAALETLAVIAYRQPVTRARVAAVRGVNCDGVIRTLLARGLVEETGTDVETGGFLYRTTELFLERLGLSSLEDLPPIAPLLPEVDSIDDV